jgi:hypothetical protein
MIKHNWKQVFLLVILLIILFPIYCNLNYDSSDSLAENIWNIVDPVAGIGAFLITIAVLYNQGKQKYLESLEKRLSVDYYLVSEDGSQDLIMQVVQAYLAGESDIRQWAQSLGGQQLAGKHLSFDLYFKTVFEAKKESDSNGDKFLHYKINMYLDEDPRKETELVNTKEEMGHRRSGLLMKEDFKNSVLTRPSKDSVWEWKRKS